MIDGTVTVLLLDRANPGIVDARRTQIGQVPIIPELVPRYPLAGVPCGRENGGGCPLTSVLLGAVSP